MTTVLASRISAGRRPAQRTMDRLARSSIPDDRITIDANFKLLDGKEQYWRHVAKNIEFIEVYTPADLDRERADKILKMQAVIKEDIENEINVHRKAISDLEQKLQMNEPVKIIKMPRVEIRRGRLSDAEIEDIILRHSVHVAAKMLGMCEDAVEYHKSKLNEKITQQYCNMTQEQRDRELLKLQPAAYAEKYNLPLIGCTMRYNHLRSVEFVQKAQTTNEYTLLCERGIHAKNHGLPWDRGDVEKLRLALHHDANIVALASNLGRTPFAVLCKAIQQGFLTESNAYKVMRSIVK